MVDARKEFLADEGLAAILVIISGFAFAGHSVLVRRGLSKTNPISVAALVLSVSLLVIWPLALLIDGPQSIPSTAFVIMAISGIMAPGLSRLLLYFGINFSGVSVATVVYATSPLFALLPAIFLLQEEITLTIVLGTLAIIVGVSIASVEKRLERVKTKGIAVVLVASFLWGMAAILRKAALNLAQVPVTAAAIASTAAFFPYVVIILSGRTKLRMEKHAIPYIVGAGMCVVVSITTLFTSIGLGRVVIVTPLANLQPLYVLGLSAIFLRKIESVKANVVIGALLAAVGAGLLAFS